MEFIRCLNRFQPSGSEMTMVMFNTVKLKNQLQNLSPTTSQNTGVRDLNTPLPFAHFHFNHALKLLLFYYY